MSLVQQLQSWGLGGSDDTSLQIQINDELDFHIHSRIDELVDSGMSVINARQQAAREFGDRGDYAKDCQRIHKGLQDRVYRLALAGLVVCMATIGWLGWTLLDMKSQNGNLSSQLNSVLASLGGSPGYRYDQDLKGKVIDADGNPVANAKVLLLHKSWPSGYRQRPYETTTDADGGYIFEKQFSSSMKNAFLVTVFADGLAMTSKYEVFESGTSVPDYDFELESVEPIKFRFLDAESGEPLAEARVFVSNRRSGDEDHLVYDISRKSATWSADENGEVTFSFFQPGDVIDFEVMVGEKSCHTTVTVDDEAGEMQARTVAIAPPVSPDLKGTVADSDGNPVADAKVLLLHKSWPGGYSQRACETTTNMQGEFLFKDQFNSKIRNAFLVTILADDLEMKSKYEAFDAGTPAHDYDFVLDHVESKTFRFIDGRGKPLANAQIFVSRRTSGGQEHLIYHTSKDSASWPTNDDGSVTFAFFKPGDTIEFGVTSNEKSANVTVTMAEGIGEEEGQIVRVDIAEEGRPVPALAATGPRSPEAVANNDAHVQWIRDHSIAFNSVDPDDEDFTDLQKLKQIVGDARVVQLGEQSHGDGTCFETKIRLIKFLHQEMGFDVLAFESGLYDCHMAWQSFKAGEDALEAAGNGVFGIWTGSAQTAAMWTYLADQAQGENPLELAGFDCQFTARASQKLREELADISDKLDGAGMTEEEWEKFDRTLGKIINNETPTQSREEFLASLEKLKEAVVKANASTISSDDMAFWRQQFASMADHCGRQWGEGEAMAKVMGRDEQMARNLIWLARERYPDRKIIVWAASFHIMRNPPGIQSIGKTVDYSEMIQMGHRVHEALGDEAYTIGFTAFKGRAGAWFRANFDIGEPPEGTLESMCEAAGMINGLVPLRGTKDSAPWLHEFQHARPMGYSWMKAKWPQHFDALIFNREMSPSTSR